MSGRGALRWGALLVLLVGLFAWWRAGGDGPSAVPPPPEPGATSAERPDADAPIPGVAEASNPAPSSARDALEPAPAEPAQAEPARPPLRMRIRTAASYASGAPRVGNVAFGVFAARGTRALDPFRAAIPLAPDDAPLFSGRTDTEGEAHVELDARGLRTGADGLPAVLARVVEPGYQQQVGFLRAPKGEPDVLECVLMATPGATVRGQVVDALGVPVGDPVSMSVHLYRWVVTEGQRGLDSLTLANRLAEGWFELHLREPVMDGQLLADASSVGTGALQDVALPLEDPPQDLRIVVRGEGSLFVRLEDMGGTPAAGMDVLVYLASLDDEHGSFVPREPDASLRRVEGLGRTWVTGWTDPTGRLDARGLRSDAYVVRVRTDPNGGYPVLLTPQPVPADGRELVLRLARPSLVVRLLDSEGRPWQMPESALDGYLAQKLKPKEAQWPELPILRAFACEARAGEPCAAGEELTGKPIAAGETVFEVEDGARYLVLAQGPGFDGSPREVEVPEGSGPVVVELRAREAGELGALALRVVHEGTELAGGFKRPWFEVGLESVGLATPLLRVESHHLRGSPFVLRAPAGLYRVVAAGLAYTDPHHGTLMEPRSLGEATAEVELVAGVTREITLTLDPGARIEITLAGESDAADLAAARERVLHPEGEDHEDEYAALAREVELFLVDPGRPREPLVHVIQGGIMGAFLRSTWRLGTTEVSECLPSGRHRLLARLPGGREARAEVELLPGATSAVKLVF